MEEATRTKDRLTYIDPNEYAGLYAKRNDSNIRNQNELSWNPEDLVMSVDLQVIIPRREDAGQTSYMVKVDGNAVKIDDGLYGRYVSYMGGVPYNDDNNSQSFLTNNYTNISYQEIANNRVVDKESLGINSIDINFDAHFFPMVTINFTDVRGSALFMLSEEEQNRSTLPDDKQFDSPSSFFKALFHFPYPRFLLSVKGFYGTKVTFQLAVSNFRSAFKPETGDYEITVQFIGYIYGLYTDLPFNLVMASPYYNTSYWTEQKKAGNFKYVNSDGTEGNEIDTYVEFLGRMEGKDFDHNALNNADNVKSYGKTYNAIEALKVIPKLYREACKSDVPTINTAKYYGKAISKNDSYVFLWGKVSTVSGIDNGNGGFNFNEESTIELYKALQNIYKNFPEYTNLIEYNNIFLSSFYKKQIDGRKLTNVDIVHDTECKYNKQFSVIGNTESLEDYFTFYKPGEIITGSTLKAYGNYVIKERKPKFEESINDEEFKNSPLFAKNSNLAKDLPFLRLTSIPSESSELAYLKIDDAKNRCVLINVSDFCDNIEKTIKYLENELIGTQDKITNELKDVYKSVIGFEPTVENYYRMLFAHLDCFFDFYTNKVLGKVKQDYDNNKRTLSEMGISASETDLPKRFSDKNVNLYPYPAYYTNVQKGQRNIKVADYPGNATDKAISEIPEVDAVKKIIDGLNELNVDYRRNVERRYNISSKQIFSPLSILYDFDNPWSSIKLKKTNNEEDILHIIYYYLCLLYADKVIGTNTGKRSKEENDGKIAYYEQLAELLFDVIGNDLDGNFLNMLHNIINNIKNGSGVDYIVNGLKETYKLYQVKVNNNEIQFDSDKIALKISDEILSTPIKDLQFENDDNNQHYLISSDKNIMALGKSWFLKDKDLDMLKTYNDSLIANGDGYEYLYKYKKEKETNDNAKNAYGYDKYPGYVSLGEFNTNLLLQKPYSIDNTIKPFIGVNKQCDFIFGTKRINKLAGISSDLNESYYQTDKYVTTVDTGCYTYQLLYNFYNTKITTGYYISFIGRKIGDLNIGGVLQVYAKGKGLLNQTKDTSTSVNLFSGVKKLLIDEETAVTYVSGLDVAEDKHWEFNEDISGEEKENYMGLLYTRRCLGLVKTTKGDYELPSWNEIGVDAKKKAQYAFAAYFLASLSGPGKLQEIFDTCMDNMTKGHSCVVRKVELLYFGASLYFAKNRYNKWSSEKNKPYIIRDIINGKGTLAYGLVKEDGGDNTNTEIDVTDLLNNSGDKIIEYFENWCDKELFGDKSMYDKLSQVHEDGKAVGYKTYDGFAAYNSGDKNNSAETYSLVQGYTQGGDCETWLTNLVFSYEYLITFHLKKETQDNSYSFSKTNIIDFLDAFYKILDTKQKEDDDRRKQLEQGNTNILSQDQNRATYYLLKNLYDKWLCTYTANEFKLAKPLEDLEKRERRFSRSEILGDYSEYNNFIYIDQFYRDISSTYIMDSDSIAQMIKDIYTGRKNIDIYTFMSFMAEKNNLMLLALPVYSNMYSPANVERIFTPNTLYNMNEKNDNPNSVGMTYVVMYTSEVSHKPGDFSQYDYDSDFLNGDLSEGSGPVDLSEFSAIENAKKSDLDYNVTAFGVSYGKQNQMYFKKVNVNMDNPKTTNESIQNTLMLADGGGEGDTSQPIAIGNNIYSIYSNRSYTCTVEMLGCMNIMPLMYFQLNNIPMFRGLYLIISVKHSIRAGDITTIFTGVRVSKYSLPDVTDVMINSKLFKRILQSDVWKDGKGISGGDEVCLDLTSGINRTRDIEYIKKSLKKALNVTDEEFNSLGFTDNNINTTSGVISKIKSLIKNGSIELKPVTGFPVSSGLENKILPGLALDLSEIYEEIKALGDDYAKCRLTSIYRPSSENSSHSAGLAVDIGNGRKNTFASNCYSSGVDTPLAYRTWEHPVVKIFMNHGWGWGIFFDGRRDYMHFSYNIDNAGDKDSNGNIKRCGH